MAKFIVLALPRSRTKWTSEFLGFAGRYTIGHDLAVECSSVADFEDALDAVDGTVETGAILGWRLLLARHPELRVATISRPLWQVMRSLEALGLGSANQSDMIARAEMLAMLALQPGVENFEFAKLSLEHEAARLWEFCLGRDFDFEWWMEMRDKNIQIDMRERIMRLAANAHGLDLLRAEILEQTKTLGSVSCALN